MYTYEEFADFTKELYDMLRVEMPSDAEMMNAYRELHKRNLGKESKVPVWASAIDEVM